MKRILLLIFAVFISCFAIASGSMPGDTTKSKSSKLYYIKVFWKDFEKHLTYFGKSSIPDYKYKKFHFALGGAEYINPLSNPLQKVFIQNGYSGLANTPETIGIASYPSGNPYIYNEKDIQTHIGIGYSLNRFLSVGLVFRNIPSVYVDGYVGKSPYDYSNPDKEEELIKGSSTEYRAEIALVSFEQNHKKIVDLFAGVGFVHYTFSIVSQMNINQYDTSTSQQIIGQTTLNNASKGWSEVLNLHADIYFSKYFSLELEVDDFLNVNINVPTQQYTDGPLTNPNLFTRTINAHTLNYKNTAFSFGLAFHLF